MGLQVLPARLHNGFTPCAGALGVVFAYIHVYYHILFLRCPSREGKRWRGRLKRRAPPPPLDSPTPLASAHPQGCSVCELLCFWARRLLFLPARSARSRAALRPERAVLNQPEFQGWFEQEWEIAFCRLICAQETILTAPYVVFRLCEVDSTCA